MLNQARDAITVRRVFGEPYEKGDVTLIPVATVAGGGGGGGSESNGEGKEGGGGFGMHVRPAGVYSINGDSVTWIPAFDLNRVIMGGQIVAVFALIALRPLFKAWATALAAKAAAEAQP